MNYTIINADWDQYRSELADVRRQVFIEEQQVPEELEWDEHDETSQHILVIDSDHQPIACGRLKTDGQIGRMAVIRQWRNKGIGSAILGRILDQAAGIGMTSVYLHAQTSAIPFYQKSGFTISSDIFYEAGIPHKTMIRTLTG